MIKAIFLDVDGTLISFKTHRVPASALDALREAHARGVQLFIATGRAAADLADLEAIPYDGVAALNGADCLMRDGRVVARHPIPRADFEKSLALSAELDFPVGLELNDGVFVNRVTPEVVRLAEMVAHPVPEQVDLRALFDRGDCCQMCFYFDPELEKRVMADFRRHQCRRHRQGHGYEGIYVRLRITGFGGRGLRRRRQRRGDAAGRRRGRGDGQCMRRGARRRGLCDGFG